MQPERPVLTCTYVFKTRGASLFVAAMLILLIGSYILFVLTLPVGILEEAVGIPEEVVGIPEEAIETPEDAVTWLYHPLHPLAIAGVITGGFFTLTGMISLALWMDEWEGLRVDPEIYEDIEKAYNLENSDRLYELEQTMLDNIQDDCKEVNGRKVPWMDVKYMHTPEVQEYVDFKKKISLARTKCKHAKEVLRDLGEVDLLHHLQQEEYNCEEWEKRRNGLRQEDEERRKLERVERNRRREERKRMAQDLKVREQMQRMQRKKRKERERKEERERRRRERKTRERKSVNERNPMEAASKGDGAIPKGATPIVPKGHEIVIKERSDSYTVGEDDFFTNMPDVPTILGSNI